MAGVKLIDLVKRYPNGFQAVNSINLEIHDKEFVVNPLRISSIN